MGSSGYGYSLHIISTDSLRYLKDFWKERSPPPNDLLKLHEHIMEGIPLKPITIVQLEAINELSKNHNEVITRRLDYQKLVVRKETEASGTNWEEVMETGRDHNQKRFWETVVKGLSGSGRDLCVAI